ncbi:MAG: metal-dependent hydrolase [Natronomonas sp.]
MPPTLVTVAAGVLLGVALLGAAFGWRAIALVALAAFLPDLDAVFGLFGIGAANATLHSVFVPLGAAALLYYDTTLRDRSWLRGRSGWAGVRIAWVAIAAYAVGGIGLDAFSTESAALFYPLSDRYYAVVGRFLISTQEGVIQTYVTLGDGWLELATPGTVETHHVDTWLDPASEERRIRLVESGWQAVLVAAAITALPAKHLIERSDRAVAGDR